MVVLRVLGGWFLLVAMVALVWDGTQTIANGAFRTTALGAHWFLISADTLNMCQAAVKRYAGGFVWDPVIISILKMPTWLVFGALGIGLLVLGRRRRTLNVYTN